MNSSEKTSSSGVDEWGSVIFRAKSGVVGSTQSISADSDTRSKCAAICVCAYVDRTAQRPSSKHETTVTSSGGGGASQKPYAAGLADLT